MNFISPLVLLRHRRKSILVIDACTPISYFSRLFTTTPVVTVIYHIWKEELIRTQYLGTVGTLSIGPLVYVAEKMTIKNSSGLPVITFSEHTAKTLGQLEKAPNPLIYIKEGIVLPKVKEKVFVENPRRGNHQLVTVGRLVRSKGIEFSLFLTSRLKDSFPDVLLHVIGTGPYVNRLKGISEKLRLDDNVVFHGYVSEEEKSAIVSQSKLMIITSKKEGFSTPAIEAGVFGVPTVGFDEFGTREAVEDGVTGVILPYGDVEGLYMACASLFTDEELYLKLSKNCKTRAKEFDNNLMIAKGANTLIALSKRSIKA